MVGASHASIRHPSDPLVLDLSSDVGECLVYTLPRFGRGLEELHPVLSCKLSAFLRIHNLRLVTLVRDQHSGDIGSRVLFDLLDPVLDVIEGVLV